MLDLTATVFDVVAEGLGELKQLLSATTTPWLCCRARRPRCRAGLMQTAQTGLDAGGLAV